MNDKKIVILNVNVKKKENHFICVENKIFLSGLNLIEK
jgi:hypothetical protein